MDQKLKKMINSEHVIVQHAGFAICSSYILTNYTQQAKLRLCKLPMQYNKDFPRDDWGSKEYVRRKVNNAPGVNFCQKFAFASTPSFYPRETT